MDWLALLSTSFLINMLIFAIIFVILFIIAVTTAGKIPKKQKLLIIDDNEDLRNDIKTFFDGFGINTVAVGTVEDFKEKLETGEFDFALVDLGLEKNDISKGLELFHQLHAKKHGDLQTFILSGHSTEETQDKFKEVFKPEIEAGMPWGTLWRDIHSRYFSKNNVQDLMHLVKEIQHIH